MFLCRCQCIDRQQRCHKIGRHLRQGAAAQGKSASAVNSHSVRYGLAQTGLHIFKKLHGLLRVFGSVRYALNQPVSFDSTTLKDLKDFMSSKFPGKDVMKVDSARRLWNFIFNGAIESIEKPDRDLGIARYRAKN